MAHDAHDVGPAVPEVPDSYEWVEWPIAALERAEQLFGATEPGGTFPCPHPRHDGKGCEARITDDGEPVIRCEETREEVTLQVARAAVAGVRNPLGLSPIQRSRWLLRLHWECGGRDIDVQAIDLPAELRVLDRRTGELRPAKTSKALAAKIAYGLSLLVALARSNGDMKPVPFVAESFAVPWMRGLMGGDFTTFYDAEFREKPSDKPVKDTLAALLLAQAITVVDVVPSAGGKQPMKLYAVEVQVPGPVDTVELAPVVSMPPPAKPSWMPDAHERASRCTEAPSPDEVADVRAAIAESLRRAAVPASSYEEFDIAA